MLCVLDFGIVVKTTSVVQSSTCAKEKVKSGKMIHFLGYESP